MHGIIKTTETKPGMTLQKIYRLDEAGGGRLTAEEQHVSVLTSHQVCLEFRFHCYLQHARHTLNCILILITWCPVSQALPGLCSNPSSFFLHLLCRFFSLFLISFNVVLRYVEVYEQEKCGMDKNVALFYSLLQGLRRDDLQPFGIPIVLG